MYMGPITAEAPAATLVLRRPASPALRRAVGVTVLVPALPVMVAWLAIHGAAASVVAAARGLKAAPRTALATIDYAGKVALGR